MQMPLVLASVRLVEVLLGEIALLVDLMGQVFQRHQRQ